ncbi:hypothetical protein [Puia dinghuensis]|uniref:Uncharacterized protein n=1 Tax=Puia dinghuensis TaxID=1792502 RepID=A0A8J2UHH6_9BACT|nr:hypothetical protein [Puia dinghuensis]GGB17533.1 hypothetical protein GCM10011511_46650 [Puia dinghuensis]
MKKITFPVLLFLLFVVNGVAQPGGLLVAPGVRLPEDPAVRTGLIGSLTGWLEQRNKPDSLNAYLLREELPVMSVLMDELRNIDWYIKRDSAKSCRCYLGNLSSLDSLRWLAQVNYMEMRGDTPMLRACCTVLTRRVGDRWVVSSMLEPYTQGWKTKAIGNCLFHYKTALNAEKAAEFVKRIGFYDRRLGAGATAIDFYSCDNSTEAMKLIGVDYRWDYNGVAFDEFSSDYGNRTVVVSGEKPSNGFNAWDPHDWWHGRLHRMVPVAKINRPVDEGMAYLYGGSWRVYSWKDILKMIQDYKTAHPGADWLALYKDGVNLMPPPKVVKISYAINALIVQRLEKENGFAASLPLLCCGPKEVGDENYFAALEKTTGVNKAGFNAYIDGLIKEALY